MRLSRLRPSPALVISLVALFVSLGGVSYGVATGFIDSREIRDNQVRSRDLRNNDIRTKDLRNNEVRGIDIRNSTIQGRDVALNTLTGTDIKESDLGQVPLAGRAISADAVSSLRVFAPVAVAQGGTPATLATYGSLTVTGACVAGMGGPSAELRVQTTEAGSSAAGTASVPVLDPSDGAQPVATADSAGPPAVASAPLVASSPSGPSLSGVVGLAASTAGGCRFHGQVAVAGAAGGQ
jgi:hypothetical protein